jgi:hypothetical protein
MMDITYQGEISDKSKVELVNENFKNCNFLGCSDLEIIGKIRTVFENFDEEKITLMIKENYDYRQINYNGGELFSYYYKNDLYVIQYVKGNGLRFIFASDNIEDSSKILDEENRKIGDLDALSTIKKENVGKRRFLKKF